MSAPSFNLTVGQWINFQPGPPAVLPGIPDVSFLAQARCRPGGDLQVESGDTNQFAIMLCCPPRQDVIGTSTPLTLAGRRLGDMIECPLGSGKYYQITYVDDVARGFLNEYRMAVMRQVQPVHRGTGLVIDWPVPIP